MRGLVASGAHMLYYNKGGSGQSWMLKQTRKDIRRPTW
jgi:hypothetical protein